MPGTAAEKLALFEWLKARDDFDGEGRAELAETERMPRAFAATALVVEEGIRGMINASCGATITSYVMIEPPCWQGSRNPHRADN
jgi:hypothetical protein